MAKTITIGPVTLWYQHLLEPSENMSGDVKYSAMVLIPKTDKRSIEKLSQAYAETATARWGTKRPASIRKPLRDGIEKEDVGPNYYFFNTSTSKKPRIYGMDRLELVDKSLIHSGNQGYLVLSPYSYDSAGNKGVGFGLTAFILTEEGENLESATSMDEIFAEIPTDTGIGIDSEDVPF